MSNNMAVVMLPLGRMLLGGLFVYGGIRHFFILEPVTNMLSARGLPAARLFLILPKNAFFSNLALIGGLLIAAATAG